MLSCVTGPIMYIYALTAFLAIGLSSNFFTATQVTTKMDFTQAKASATAYNMAQYTQAVSNYYKANPLSTATTVQMANLKLPNGYKPMQAWTNTRNPLSGEIRVSAKIGSTTGVIAQNVARHAEDLKMTANYALTPKSGVLAGNLGGTSVAADSSMDETTVVMRSY